MRVRRIQHDSIVPARSERLPLPGTGILLVGAASLLMWGMIVGIAALV